LKKVEKNTIIPPKTTNISMFSLKLLLLSTMVIVNYALDSPVHELTNDNWRQTLEGEWMVKFYAPWCPACRNMVSDWKKFAEYVEPLGVKVADVDITKESLLNGKFMVTALPTIFQKRRNPPIHLQPKIRRPFIIHRR